MKELIPDDPHLHNWLDMASERIQFQGLPARICWVGLGDRHRLGLAFNEMVRAGELKAPIVIGRDHLDSGSVASPNRETEAMRDGSDAVSDWPLLNALLNCASGATWVSLHHGGGVGMGFSQHAGMVIVCDGTPEAARRIERVLWNDPATGVMRHADLRRQHGLDADLLGEARLEGRECGARLHRVVARMGQVDGDVGLDPSGARRHHDDAVAEEDRLLDVVGDEQHGLALPLPDPEQEFLHERTGLVVERAEGLVEEQDGRIVGERPGDRGALLHAARELLRIVLLEAAQSDLLDIGGGDGAPFRGRHAFLAQPVFDVLVDREPREQGVGLEHHAAVRAGAAHLAAVGGRGRPSARRGPPRCARGSTSRIRTDRGS